MKELRRARRAASCSLVLLAFLASCATGPREVPLGAIAQERRFAHARDATQLLFPNLEVQDAESGWIVSLPLYVGGIDRRRLRAYVHVFAQSPSGSRAEIWVEREVFSSKWLFGLLGSEGWTSDGRDDVFEERLVERMTPTREP